MARVQTSALITSLSGKVGGSVFQGSQGGIVLRNQSQTINRATSLQQQNKIGMVAVQQAWQGLTAAQIAVWDAYAIYLAKKQKNNVGKNLSGQQLFINQNQLRYAISYFHAALNPVIILDPVLQLDPAIFSILSVNNSGGTLTFTGDRSINLNSWIQLKMSRPLRPSQLSSYNKKQIIPFAFVGNVGTWNITTAYTNIYGRVPAVGEYVVCSLTTGYDTENGNSPLSVQRIEVEA